MTWLHFHRPSYVPQRRVLLLLGRSPALLHSRRLAPVRIACHRCLRAVLRVFLAQKPEIGHPKRQSQRLDCERGQGRGCWVADGRVVGPRQRRRDGGSRHSVTLRFARIERVKVGAVTCGSHASLPRTIRLCNRSFLVTTTHHTPTPTLSSRPPYRVLPSTSPDIDGHVWCWSELFHSLKHDDSSPHSPRTHTRLQTQHPAAEKTHDNSPPTSGHGFGDWGLGLGCRARSTGPSKGWNLAASVHTSFQPKIEVYFTNIVLPPQRFFYASDASPRNARVYLPATTMLSPLGYAPVCARARLLHIFLI